MMIGSYPVDGLHGRRKIFTTEYEINADNVVRVLTKVLPIHNQNAGEIQYLWDYYRGRQDIRTKQRVVRDSVNNIVCMNRANEIVTFKTSYLLDKPIQYVSTSSEDNISDAVNRLNGIMRMEDKESKDKEICDWIHICGIGERLVVAGYPEDEYDTAVNVYTVDPRLAFVVYNGGIGQQPVMAVIKQMNNHDEWYYCVYTKTEYFEIYNDNILYRAGNPIGMIPLVEYENNFARMGAFEIVIPMLNAINTLESNRVDNIEDFVNAFDVFQNCEISDDGYKDLTAGGKAIMIKCTVPGMEAKVYRVSSELNQTSTQTIVDDMYDAVLTICGMPNRNNGGGSSDNGVAVIYRDGYQAAEGRAADTEKIWKRSEKQFIKLVLKVLANTKDALNVGIPDIDIEFTRRNLANVQSKAQVLCEMLNNDKIHPKLAFLYSGMFADPEDAYKCSMEWYNENQAKLEEDLNDYVGTVGSTDKTDEQEESPKVSEDEKSAEN